VVYVNLDRKLISFETPKVYASGEALAGEKGVGINIATVQKMAED